MRIVSFFLFLFTMAFWPSLQAEQVKVAATIGQVADVVAQVGGERVEVIRLMGPGVDPHLYKPTASDARMLAEVDLIFYNGLMLEGRMADLFARLGRSGRKVYALTEQLDPALLLEPEEFEGHYDPHVWFDVSLWASTVPLIVEALSEHDAKGADDYRKNGELLMKNLEALHEWCVQQAASIPEEKRILITSHDAFNYFGRAYKFQVVGLQGVSTVSEASLADMSGMVDFVKQHKVPAIFVESSVNPAALQRVSEDAGVSIGGELFSDAMGAAGDMKDGFDVGTYEGMVRYNMHTLVKNLSPATAGE